MQHDITDAEIALRVAILGVRLDLLEKSTQLYTLKSEGQSASIKTLLSKGDTKAASKKLVELKTAFSVELEKLNVLADECHQDFTELELLKEQQEDNYLFDLLTDANFDLSSNEARYVVDVVPI